MTDKMKKAVITGVSGQDGSYLAELLLEEGYEVYGVVRRTSVNNLERLEEVLPNPHFHLEKGDITDFSSMFRLLEKIRPDEVYNLAAQSHVHVSFDEPLHALDVTAKGCWNILESIRILYGGFCRPKFYQASSSEMFGTSTSHQMHHGDDGTLYDDRWQDEQTRFSPQSPYAISKLAAHELTRLYRKSYNIHASCGILFNHTSPRRGENFVERKITKYLAYLYHNSTRVYALGQSAPTITYQHHPVKLKLGNLAAYRDIGYAPDYVRAMHLMLQQTEPDDYVIATGETYTIKEFLVEAFKAIDIYDYGQFVSIDKGLFRPSEVPYLCGKSEKAYKKLGWKPEITFKELVKLMVEEDIKNYKGESDE